MRSRSGFAIHPILTTFDSKLVDILCMVSKNIHGYVKIGSGVLNYCSKFAEMALQNLSTSLLYFCHLKSVQDINRRNFIKQVISFFPEENYFHLKYLI